MTFVPLSLQELGQRILRQPLPEQVQLLGKQGFIPTLLDALSGLGPAPDASYSSHFKPQLRIQPPKNMSWLGTAVGGEPCPLTQMLKVGGRRFASARIKAEGSEYPDPAPSTAFLAGWLAGQLQGPEGRAGLRGGGEGKPGSEGLPGRGCPEPPVASQSWGRRGRGLPAGLSCVACVLQAAPPAGGRCT